MKVFIFFMMFLLNTAFADELQITLLPKEPVMGESFNVTFKVISKTGTDPIINFNPSSGIEVVGREEAGVTTSTSYINGHLSIERSVSIVYEMIASTPGSKFLRNISVDLNGNVLKHANVRIPVLRKARRPKNIMAIAEVDKEDVYVGESILVRYYLYNRVTVNTTDIKKFPKLDKFLKRYHQERMTVEKVRYNGEIYTRRVLYTAQLFADKAGDFKIDPISLRVQYYANRANSYSGLGLGFGLRRQMSTTVSSKPIRIHVKSLPVENVPKYFTGLVGKHEFTLTQNKNKFLVNDPIELKFTVRGKGALELFQAPNFLDNPAIEEFDASSDLVINSDFSATKTFNITDLGRSPVKISETKIPLSYFDPESHQYVTVYVDLKPITVAGGGQRIRSSGKEEPRPNPVVPRAKVDEARPVDLTPIYKMVNSYVYRSQYINYFLIFVLLVITGIGGWRYLLKRQKEEDDLIKEIKKNGLNFGRLHELISQIGYGHDMREIVLSSQLPDGVKKTIISLIDKCEKDYAQNGKTKNYKISAGVLKKIVEYINERDESLQ